MRAKRFSFGTALCLIGMLMLILSAAFIPASYVFAADDCSLTISYSANSTTTPQTTWSAYKIGSRNPYGGFTLEGSFADTSITLEGLTTEALSEAAYSLETYAIANGLKADATGKTNTSGTLTLSGLEEGIYLVFSEDVTTDDYIYQSQPSIVEVGGFEDKNVTISPKTSITTITHETTTYSVRKVWTNETSDAARPTSLKIELYKDGALYDTITLDSSNGWYYEWESDDSAVWRVAEKNIPTDYTVSYTSSDTKFYITNTYSTTTTTTEPTTTTTAPTTTTTVTTTTTTDTTESTTTTTTSSQQTTTTTTVSTVATTTTTVPPREELERLIDELEELNEFDYTEESWAEFKEILDRAKLILSGGDATDEEITAILQELKTAQSKLVYSSLPQTGQLWWPVPIFAGGGLVLIATGVRLNKKKDGKDDE
ncbi:MAG: hypothetical protein LUH57_06905 [Ruminococcus sp.]|nr:hypothetical protein [Ruminococcus sp.]